jgi:hypothetical protein
VTLPTGEFSEFGANIGAGRYDYCGQHLTMPTELKGQNGLEIHQETPITITGCAPAITILSHKVTGHTATIRVSVPSAGASRHDRQRPPQSHQGPTTRPPMYADHGRNASRL